MKFLGRLLLWHKLLLVVVALLVPSALLAVFYLKSANQTVSQANAEISGARYSRALDEFLYVVIRHRAMSSVVLNGDATHYGQPVKDAPRIERIWNELTCALPFFTVCSYPIECFEHSEARNLLSNVCAEHSAVSHTRNFAHRLRDIT